METNTKHFGWWAFCSWVVVLSFIGISLWWWYTPSVGKSGVLLAVGATLMAPFWEKVGIVGKMSWILMLFLLLGVEYRAIDLEHIQYLSDQKEAHDTLLNGFSNLLQNQQTSFQKMLDASQGQFATTMKQFRQTTDREKSIQDTAMLAYLSSESIWRQMQISSGATNISRPPVAPPPAKENTLELKQQALQLAKDIDDWIVSVSQDAPQAGDLDKELAYRDRLQAEFRAKFVPGASQMVGRLHIHGLNLACRPLGSPNQSYFILDMQTVCANAIEKAALDLKD